MRQIFHVPGNVDVTVMLFIINVSGDSKYVFPLISSNFTINKLNIMKKI